MFNITTVLRGALLSSVVLLGASGVAVAQTNPSELRPWEGPQDDDQNSVNNVFSNSAGPGSLLELLNRLQQADGVSQEEFERGQEKNWNNAISDFHEKQKERIENPGAQVVFPTNIR